jgi:Flp pilus assembly protein TadG
MLGASIIHHIRKAARRFVGANDGNIAVIFTLAAIPVIGFVGAAIDYSRVNSARSSMQSAIDSTALMLSKDITSGAVQPTAAAVTAAAQSYFTALYTNPDGKLRNPNGTAATVGAVYTPNNGNLGNTVQLTVNGSVSTDFMKVLSTSLSTMNFTITSTTAWGNVKMRVALALDNTGSMADDGKITALRNAVAATGGLIDQLSALAKNPGDVYISVIPFAKVVNVGSKYAGATWIDWTDWLNPPNWQPNNALTGMTNYQAALPVNWHSIGPGAPCPFSNNTGGGGFTCTSGPVNGSSNASGSKIPSSVTYQGQTITGPICPSVDYNSHTLYNGCWDSVATGKTEPFCAGSSSCNCNSVASADAGSCFCTGSGSNTSCTGKTYTHHWTQPSVTAASAPNVIVGYQTKTGSNTYNEWTPNNNSSNVTTPVNNVWTGASTNPTSTWTGCITDRTQSYDETGDAPTSNIAATLFPANQYYENSEAYCLSNNSPALEPIMPMSYDWSTMKTNINAMQPTGGTNQSVGLAWAWQSLQLTGPIPAPSEDSNTTYNRVIIILSDGLNTEDRWPAYGNGSTQNTSSGVGYIDARQAQQCANIKAVTDSSGKPMYTIYAIQVNTSSPADATSTVLQNCASDSSKFFMLTKSSQIATTFTTIGTALSQLRVAK